MPYLELGSTPPEESCVQVVRDTDYLPAMRQECQKFKSALETYFAPIPDGVFFSIKSNPHDFGSYLEVVIRYDESIPESVEFAFMVEGSIPGTWEELQIPHTA